MDGVLSIGRIDTDEQVHTGLVIIYMNTLSAIYMAANDYVIYLCIL